MRWPQGRVVGGTTPTAPAVDAADDVVTLANGDQLAGFVDSLSAEALVLQVAQTKIQRIELQGGRQLIHVGLAREVIRRRGRVENSERQMIESELRHLAPLEAITKYAEPGRTNPSARS